MLDLTNIKLEDTDQKKPQDFRDGLYVDEKGKFYFCKRVDITRMDMVFMLSLGPDGNTIMETKTLGVEHA